MSFSLITVSAYEIEWKMLYTVLSSLCIFLSPKTSLVMYLKPLIPVNKSISSFLIIDSASLSYSSNRLNNSAF